MTDWERQLELWAARGLRRTLRPLAAAGPRVEREGRYLINLASNDYLGLSTDPRLVRAAQEALARWGVGAGASRLVSGDRRVHAALEAALADFKGTEAALVFTSGYAANVGVLAALAGPRDQIFADALNHASLNDGARLSRARLRYYRHRDLDHLEDLLKGPGPRRGGRRFIVTDAVFSMDADLAPLPALVELAERYEALLVVDDAHGSGVVGPEGRGTVHHFGLAGRVPVQVATLSKALGGQGGVVAGARALVEVLLHRARAFIYSTGIAPALAAAALEAVRLVRGPEGEARRARLRQHLARLKAELRAKGYRVLHEDPAPMLLVWVGAPGPALRLAAHLEARGVLAPAIRPPTVPEGTSRLRLAPMATHTEVEIERVIQAFPPAEEVGV
ncbi:8-amino-7-oxononanoate synthase [Marinithermus hydrothermalis]|uniref:8-amino-7-ketopelargonate synthase n=1 Tax=Marinithermus hydrothermalis (strain DSM 14884 / JCM 11576 / T1) TaxID=869210 RepID=F2NR34_MARHT|nr:8-amino-7-oxononanoate synthase [Marinithermus hydrothermalis]AEB12612.1 8-amino-7-oxononanoate synthase [Marinithermus hydrothermalis DSM 14884]